MKWWVERDGRRVEISVAGEGQRFAVRVDGSARQVSFLPVAANLAAMLGEDGSAHSVAHQRLGPGRWRISLGDREFVIQLRDPLEREVAHRSSHQQGPQEIRAPIPGKVVRLAVDRGDVVLPGQPLLVLEAMKMETNITAPVAGKIAKINVAAGENVAAGQVVVEFE